MFSHSIFATCGSWQGPHRPISLVTPMSIGNLERQAWIKRLSGLAGAASAAGPSGRRP